jgi:hypothetical protein
MATSTATRSTSRALPQPTDLLLVQRGSTPYRATADEVKAFMLSPATAAAIGAIKPGTNLSVDADGTLHAAIPGALTYRGAIDPTSDEAPADAAVGDVYLASASGVALASWSGIAGQEIAQGDLLLFDGEAWSANAALGPDGAGVIRIQVVAPLSVDQSDPAQPLLSVEPSPHTEAAGSGAAGRPVGAGGRHPRAGGGCGPAAGGDGHRPAGRRLHALDLSTLPALP